MEFNLINNLAKNYSIQGSDHNFLSIIRKNNHIIIDMVTMILT